MDALFTKKKEESEKIITETIKNENNLEITSKDEIKDHIIPSKVNEESDNDDDDEDDETQTAPVSSFFSFQTHTKEPQQETITSQLINPSTMIDTSVYSTAVVNDNTGYSYPELTQQQQQQQQ
mmetsp:Transcript_50694/g.64946  ORF Transcript_50694/g.64946 Transcript_50694/m.64946 type:complete len:123 (+) Transcript_50694:3-371(+)